MIKSIKFNAVEEKMIRDLQEFFGYHTAGSVIREALRLLHQEKMPPAYARKLLKDEPVPKTALQWCQEQDGILIFKGTERFCRVMDGAMEVDKPVPKELI